VTRSTTLPASARNMRIPFYTVLLSLACAAVTPLGAQAPATDDDLHLLRLEATPVGGLPPLALPMPASRNHNYWGGRLQAGHRRERHGPDLLAVAAGVDYQYSGGSTIGLTGGFQDRDCDLAGKGCGRHAMVGARSRFSILTGASALAGVFGDNSATNTLGAEFGVGYAPKVLPGMNACTVDFGLPFSVALFQRVRLVSYVTPGFVLDVDCSNEGRQNRGSYLGNFGIGLQQFGSRELDIYLGVQRIFRGNSGYQVGISVTYVRLP